MGLQKFHASEADPPDANGAVAWRAPLGRVLALVKGCPTPWGPRTVYATNYPDTFFSIPAGCRVKGKDVRGYLTQKDGCWEFRPYKAEQ
jgi:hypothetical protein